MIGIYGGTFDPIHFGHLRSALDVAEQLGLSKVLMIPSAQPPHRETPVVSVEHRWQMLQLALEGQQLMVADDREIQRKGPSYTYDTLTELRQEYNGEALCLIQGGDVFQKLHTWHRWQELLDLTHIVVMRRAGENVLWDALVEKRYSQCLTNDKTELEDVTIGKIIELDVVPLSISATQIRDKILMNKEIKYLLPDKVLAHIDKHKLYRNH